MISEFYRGFSVYKNSENGIVIVAPHSGPALETTTSRDDNSETVASLCFKKMGGTLIISNMSRKRYWGIDFNRDIPSKETATKMFDMFSKENNNVEALYEYRKQ